MKGFSVLSTIVERLRRFRLGSAHVLIAGQCDCVASEQTPLFSRETRLDCSTRYAPDAAPRTRLGVWTH